MTETRTVRRLLAATAVGVLAISVSACSTTTSGRPHAAAARDTAHPVPTSPSGTPRAKTHKTAAVRTHVRVTSFEGDGDTYGVGMPIVLQFDKKVTDPAAFERTVRVRLNGRPAHGAWFWEQPRTGYPMEAHYRQANYWPAHSSIEVSAPLAGVGAGRGRAFGNGLTVGFRIGAAHISSVDASDTSPSMTVTSDGKVVNRFPASLGKAGTPTYRGVKVVEELDREQDMGGAQVPWSVRVTTSGEFVHAASWNTQIGQANLSHGCTNLTTADAEWFFHFSRQGDVVRYDNAPGPTVDEGDGLGDWNVAWDVWQQGGLL